MVKKEITDFYNNNGDHWIVGLNSQNSICIQIDAHVKNEKGIPYIDFTNDMDIPYSIVKKIVTGKLNYYELFNAKGLVKTLTITENNIEINFVQSGRKFVLPFDELNDLFKQYVDNYYFGINLLNKKEPSCGLADPDGDYYDMWQILKYQKAKN